MLVLIVNSLAVVEIQTLISLHPRVRDASHCTEANTKEDAEKDHTDGELRDDI